MRASARVFYAVVFAPHKHHRPPDGGGCASWCLCALTHPYTRRTSTRWQTSLPLRPLPLPALLRIACAKQRATQLALLAAPLPSWTHSRPSHLTSARQQTTEPCAIDAKTPSAGSSSSSERQSLRRQPALLCKILCCTPRRRAKVEAPLRTWDLVCAYVCVKEHRHSTVD